MAQRRRYSRSRRSPIPPAVNPPRKAPKYVLCVYCWDPIYAIKGRPAGDVVRQVCQKVACVIEHDARMKQLRERNREQHTIKDGRLT